MPYSSALQRIGAVAHRSGLPVKTIRFYCDAGLIQPSGRTAGGYRLFAESVFAELTLLRTLRSLDLPLETIRRILQARREGVCTCASLQGTIRGKAEEIAGQIDALQQLRAELETLLRDWRPCGGRPSGGQQPSAVHQHGFGNRSAADAAADLRPPSRGASVAPG